MFIEYRLKGVNPNGRSDEVYEGIFSTDGFSVIINQGNKVNPAHIPLIHLSGNGFNYFSLSREEIDAVYDGLKKALTHINAHVLDLGFIRPLSVM